MSFRRDGRLENRWKRWVRDHEGFLIGECGLPTLIVTDREAWFHFLDRGFAHDVELPSVSDRVCGRLIPFLTEHEGTEFGPQSRVFLKNLCLWLDRDESMLEPGTNGS